ncbi:hypothetical protein [Novosphingobium sp. 11B]
MRYLTISQGSGLFSSKITYDFVLPFVVALPVTIFVQRMHVSLGLFADSGLVPNVINLLNLLIAFFIAALAAVATFDRVGLDDHLKGEPAILRRKNNRSTIVEHVLTHRQFVCYLFGYLSFTSIILLFGLYVARMFGDQLREILEISAFLRIAMKSVGGFAFFFLLAQLAVTMLLGIYFLCDRLQFMDDTTV